LRILEHWCPSTNKWCVDALIRQKCQDAGGNANTRRRAETGLHSGPSSVDFFKMFKMPLPHPCLAQQSVRVLGILDPGSGFRDPGSGVWAQGTGIPDPISGVCAGSAGPGSGIVGPRGTGMTMPTHPRPNLLRTVTTFEELASIYNGDRKGLEEILCRPVTPHMADAASLTRGNVDWNRCQIASDRLASANYNFRHFPRGYRKRKRRSS